VKIAPTTAKSNINKAKKTKSSIFSPFLLFLIQSLTMVTKINNIAIVKIKGKINAGLSKAVILVVVLRLIKYTRHCTGLLGDL